MSICTQPSPAIQQHSMAKKMRSTSPHSWRAEGILWRREAWSCTRTILGWEPAHMGSLTQLLEIKRPFKSSISLAEFLGWPNGDIKSLGDGQYLILPKRKDGHYLQTQLTMMCLGLQSCKLVIWTPSEDIELDIPFDKNYTDAQVQQLQNFYFLHMLPSINLRPKYLQIFNA